MRLGTWRGIPFTRASNSFIIYSKVEEIARANSEPSHHITGNIILSPTLLKLISLGIRSLSGNYAELANTPTNSGKLSDTLSPRVDAIEEELTELKKLVAELSGKLSDPEHQILVEEYLARSIPDGVCSMLSFSMVIRQLASYWEK